MDDDGQIIFGDLGGLKLPDICLTGEEKPRKKKHTQETCPDRELNPGPLRDRRACYRLVHSGSGVINAEARRGKGILMLKDAATLEEEDADCEDLKLPTDYDASG